MAKIKEKGTKKIMGIRGKILTTFTVMALIPLLLLGVFTAISITDLGEKSVDDSTTALKTQANMDMTTQTEDKATQVEKFFDDLERDTQFLKDFANDLYNYPAKYDTEDIYPSYKYPSKTVPYLPAWGYVHTANDERKGAWADWEGMVQTCPYLNSSVVKRAAEDQEYADWLNAEIELTVIFDYIFKPVYERNQPSVVNVWMVRHGGLTNSYSVPPLDYGQLLVDGEITDDWDEDAEEYVTLANPMYNPKKNIVWTDPYFDPVGNGWLVSCIGPIYKGSEFIGTVGIDLQLDTILKSVLEISMYKTGHAFLIDGSGNTIAHKDLDKVRDSQMLSDPDNTEVNIQTLESSSTEFVELLDDLADTHQGVEEVTYEDGGINYIGFSEILLSTGTDFYLGIVVPEIEVIESVKSTEKSIEDATNETLILIIIIDLIALMVILSVGLAVANRIVTPINQMISVSKRLGVGEIDETLLQSSEVQIDPKKAKKDEIGTLMKSFSNMISSINEKKNKEKKLKAKEQEPIPQQLVQDIKIEIKDSVIHRSTIGSPSTAAATGETRYCLNCGKDLPAGFSGKFCPYCGEEP